MVVGLVVGSRAIAPIAIVGKVLEIEAKVLPPSPLTHIPPPAAPTKIRPATRGSRANAVRRPVALASGGPRIAPPKSGSWLSMGWGPRKCQVRLGLTSGAAWVAPSDGLLRIRSICSIALR